MNRHILYFQIVILSLLVGCTSLKYEFTVIPRINSSAREAERIFVLYTSSNDTHIYNECIKNTFTQYIKNKIINEHDHIIIFILYYSLIYITTPEKASPYNYHNFVKFIKTGGEDNDKIYEMNKYDITKTLQDWTNILYGTCGQYAYTIEERCAALSAVEMTPEWCARYSK